MTESRHILLIVSDMGLGGAQRAAATLCNGFADRGHCVELIETYSAGGDCAYRLSPAVGRIHWGRKGKRVRSRLLSRVQRLRWLRALLCERHDAVVISFLTDVNVAVLIARFRLPVTVIVSERIYPGLMPLSGWLKWMRWRLYGSADAVVGQTEAAAEWLSQNIPAVSGRVVPNALSLPADSDQRSLPTISVVKDSDRLVLGVGRLSDQKGFGTLIEAFAALPAEERGNTKLVILGEGGERQALEGKARDLGLSDRVCLPGPVGNLGEWYRRADIFVLSSRFEGFPNALLEAQAHGVACVSFDCLAGPADLIDHNQTGILVDLAAGAGGLAQAVGDLLGDPLRREAMAAAAKTASQRYETPRIIAQWEALIAELVDQRDRDGRPSSRCQ